MSMHFKAALSPGELSIRKTKAHASQVDDDDCLTTFWVKAWNDSADKFAKPGAALRAYTEAQTDRYLAYARALSKWGFL